MNYPMNQISDHLIFSPLFSRKAGGSGDFGFGLGDLQRQNRDLDGGQDDDGAMAAMDDDDSWVCELFRTIAKPKKMPISVSPRW